MPALHLNMFATPASSALLTAAFRILSKQHKLETGYPASLCGGDLRINLYLNQDYTPAPTVLPNSGAFRSQGCFADSSDNRLLDSGSFTDAAGMTVAQCVSLAGPSKYATVEFHSECYWGSTLSRAQISDASCDAACAGDSTEFCGGTWAANVYLNENFVPPAVVPSSGTFRSRACFTDGTYPRLLSSGHSTDYGSMTVAKCISLAGPSYKYAAIEFYGECYWGNTLALSQTADSSCDAACAGDSTQLCGGTWVANVYENSAYQSPESLSRAVVLALIQQHQALMTTLNNDVQL